MQPTLKNYTVYSRRFYVLFLCTSLKLFNRKPELSKNHECIEMKKLIIKKKKKSLQRPQILQ